MTNILVSALVALVVTLATEWFFKPSLEARKEFKLEQHRARRAIINITRDYIWRIEQRLTSADRPAEFEDFRSEFIRHRAAIDLPRHSEKREAMAVLTQIMEGSGNRQPPQQHAILLAAIDVIETPHWKRKKFQGAVQTFHKRVVGATRFGGNQQFGPAPGNQLNRK